MTEIKKAQIAKKNKGKIILLSKYAVCNTKKSRFIKKQEARGLLSSLGLKTPLIKVLPLGEIYF